MDLFSELANNPANYQELEQLKETGGSRLL